MRSDQAQNGEGIEHRSENQPHRARIAAKIAVETRQKEMLCSELRHCGAQEPVGPARLHRDDVDAVVSLELRDLPSGDVLQRLNRTVEIAGDGQTRQSSGILAVA